MNPKSDPKTVKNSPILNFSAKQAAVLKRNKRFL